MSDSGEVLAIVLEAVYACAADPDRWEDLFDMFVPLDGQLSAEDQLGETGLGVEQTLRPHLDRAEAVARRLNMSDTASAAAALAVAPNNAPPPVAYLLIGRDLRLLSATPSAAPMLASFCEPLAEGRVFALSDVANQNRYRAARDALRDGAGTAPVLFNVDDGEATESLSGFLVDADHFDRLIGTPEPGVARAYSHALILPDRTALVRHDHLLRSSLGLTPAELKLASLLKDGASINEAAPKLGIAVNTARNQLRSIFAKLGVNRQSEMVRHLSELGQLAAFVRGAELTESAEPSPAILQTNRIKTERREVGLSDGRRLSYREYGRREGKPVLFLHAVLSGSLLREAESDIAYRLGLRLIVPERPGTGRSTPSPDMSIASVGRDLVELVDQLEHQNVIILGRSSGAHFALEAAKQLGARVPRLMLWSPRFCADLEMTRRDPLGRFYAGMRRMPWYVDAALALLRAKLSRGFIKSILLRSHERSPADYALMEREPGLLDFMVRQSLEALEFSHEGVIREADLIAADQPLDLEGLQSEMIVWHGSADGYVHLYDVERHVSNLPLAEYRVIENEGHIFSLAAREKVFERLIA
jgi:pimeloyl-ACP methyl ester carboxylesterase/DNA-binding CsgD family transcriptional regulator